MNSLIIKVIIFFIAITSVCYIYGNDSILYTTVKGIVKDSKTNERLPFASLTINGSSVATVANSEGEFALKVPTLPNQFMLEVSHLGYENKQFTISLPVVNNLVCFLQSSSIAFDSVIVKPINARNLVIDAVLNINKNYSTVSCNLQAFYREYIKQGNNYLSISEAQINLYKTPYNNSATDRVKVIKARKGYNIKRSDTLAIKLQGGPSVLLMLDVIKNPDELFINESLENYYFELTNIVNINNDLNYVISFSPNTSVSYPLYNGKLYISKKYNAITNVTFNISSTDINKASQQFLRKKPMGLVFSLINANYMVTYKLYNGMFYLNYIRSEIKFKCDWKKRWFKNNYTIVSEQVITNIDNENVVKPKFDETFKPTDIFADKAPEYFTDNYWNNQNIIEPEESIQEAIKKFNKQVLKHQKNK